MNHESTILLGRSPAFTQDLIDVLKAHKDSTFKIKLCFDDGKDWSTRSDKLIVLCNKLYNKLIDAQRCIEVCADLESKNDEHCIYYDKRQGFNGGATDLLKDVKELLDSYHDELVQIDLTS